MRSRDHRLISFLMLGFVAAALFGCVKEEKAPAPEAEGKGSAGYEALLPSKDLPTGWRQSGEVKTYVGKKLYDSIDGAADRFFQYAFREQYVAGYSSNDSGKSINIEVYDMGTPEDAFGIFSCHDNVMSEHVGVGLAATISEINLDFCRGKHFARLLGMGFEEGEAKKPLRAFAEAIAGNIEPGGELPELVKRLPEGYVEGSLLFFHTAEILNERRYVAEENIFRLNEKTNGVLAAYTAEEKETFKLEKDILYIIEYPDEKAAQDAKMSWLKFADKLVTDSRAEGQPPSDKLQLIGLVEPTEIHQLYKGEGGEQHLMTIMRVFRNTIFGVWEITDAEKAKSLAKTLAENLKR